MGPGHPPGGAVCGAGAGDQRARKWLDPGALNLARHLITTGAWWDLVDEIAGHFVDPILRVHPAAVSPIMRAWAHDDDLWIRRTAVLCQLSRKAETDTELLRDVIEANLDDRSFWLRKAIGWALRHHARTDPDWVRAMLRTWDGRISDQSRREASRHLGVEFS